MTHMEAIDGYLKGANAALTWAYHEYSNPALQTTHILQALHEAIAAMDSVYLHLQETTSQTEQSLLATRATA